MKSKSSTITFIVGTGRSAKVGQLGVSVSHYRPQCPGLRWDWLAAPIDEYAQGA